MTTGIIIQARLGSSRLPQKALKPIDGVASLTWCIGQCKKIKGVDKIVLATTFEQEDEKLVNFCYGENMYLYRGSQDDLVVRHYGAAQRYGVDIVIRITGDCPVVSPEIAEILLKSHLETAADYTEAVRAAVGTSCQVWKASTFEKLLTMGVRWECSEHMSYFVIENPDIFKVNKVELPLELIRDYRLTLDYQEDLDMFNKIFEYLGATGTDPYDIKNIFRYLDSYPEIAKMNAHCQQMFNADWVQALLKKENERIRTKRILDISNAIQKAAPIISKKVKKIFTGSR